MSDSFHYPPDVFTLVADVIPLLCRSKKDVVLFFKGAGVLAADLAPVEIRLRANPKEINKYEMSRTILTSVNSKGDSYLAVRREILKRIVEFEDFSTCWPDNQFKAKGMVADIKKIVNVRDSFTRMKQERDSERQETAEKRRAKRAAEVQNGEISRRLVRPSRLYFQWIAGHKKEARFLSKFSMTCFVRMEYW